MFLFYDKQNLYCSVLPRLRQIPAPAHRNSIVSHYMAPSTINGNNLKHISIDLFLTMKGCGHHMTINFSIIRDLITCLSNV